MIFYVNSDFKKLNSKKGGKYSIYLGPKIQIRNIFTLSPGYYLRLIFVSVSGTETRVH